MNTSIGEKIAYFRKRKELSQEQVAEKLGMSPQGYGKIERGDTDVNFSRLEEITKALEISIADLFGYGEKGNFYNNTNSPQILSSNANLNINLDKELLHQKELLLAENEKLKMEISYLKKLLQVAGIGLE